MGDLAINLLEVEILKKIEGILKNPPLLEILNMKLTFLKMKKLYE